MAHLKYSAVLMVITKHLPCQCDALVILELRIPVTTFDFTVSRGYPDGLFCHHGAVARPQSCRRMFQLSRDSDTSSFEIGT